MLQDLKAVNRFPAHVQNTGDRMATFMYYVRRHNNGILCNRGWEYCVIYKAIDTAISNNTTIDFKFVILKSLKSILYIL